MLATESFSAEVSLPQAITLYRLLPCELNWCLLVWTLGFLIGWMFVPQLAAQAQVSPVADYRAQSMAVQSDRISQALEMLGSPLSEARRQSLVTAQTARDAVAMEQVLDDLCICTVTINPESRVKVTPGAARARLQQAGYTAWLVKVINQGAVQSALRVSSPQAGPSYAGVALLSMQRQDQLALRENEKPAEAPPRFLHLEWFDQAPMSRVPSGAASEYAILLVYASDAGERAAVFEFSVGGGTQDLGFRAQLPLQLAIEPALPVQLTIRDEDGQPAFARLTIRDRHGHVFPPQPRRLAPDFFFQPHIYRQDGETVLLPPGRFTIESSQGPETIVQQQSLDVAAGQVNRCSVELVRWVHPLREGWISGDHHIHGAGCAHYTSPTEGVTPADMFRQVAGEGLNVGCILTWGPCFEHQRQFFRPDVDAISRPRTLLKYDIEISGFGSQALGHVCLLNLRDQTYPGSDGTKEKGWPTWATPALQWAKQQGAVTGFAHSASGLQIDPQRAAARMHKMLDTDQSQLLSRAEAESALLPARFDEIDSDNDGGLSRVELQSAIDRAADQLPNLAIPEMNSVGAMELPVAVTVGACDFISTMDTARIPEWNMWYHVLNCGFPLKASGETDFPCMSGNAVGQGRVYVLMPELATPATAIRNDASPASPASRNTQSPKTQSPKTQSIDFAAWCRGLAAGRSYVSDGYAHALSFQVMHLDKIASSGDTLRLAQPGKLRIAARIAIAAHMPRSVAYATRLPEGGRRFVGDTVTLHGSASNDRVPTGERTIELVVNGQSVAAKTIQGNGSEQLLEFEVNVDRSSWIALRAFPHLHTNPVEVLIADKPIRASSDSARWCIETIEQLWRQREKNIAATERNAAEQAFQEAIEIYRQRARECK